MGKLGWVLASFALCISAHAKSLPELANITGEYKLVKGKDCSSGRVAIEGTDADPVVAYPGQNFLAFINQGLKQFPASGPEKCREEANTILQVENGIPSIREVVERICPQASETTTTVVRFPQNKMTLEFSQKHSDPKKSEARYTCEWVKKTTK